jgi:succinyl-diaminopimelate desuccinylase
MKRRYMITLALAVTCLMLTSGANPGLLSPADVQMPGLYDAYDSQWAPRLAPLLTEVIRFPTTAGNAQAFIDQKAWIARVASDLGFTFRDRGKVTEVELPGPTGAPVLGLAVHGDVVSVDDHWTIPPFAGVVKDGMVLGRGSADDKGPLIQALLAMKTLQESGMVRTHTIRLLIGSDEETTGTDMKEYLRDHPAPDVTLVLDSAFPVIVGERAVNTLTVDATLTDRRPSRFGVAAMTGGLASNIVPDSAVMQLERSTEARDDKRLFAALQARLAAKALPAGTTLETSGTGSDGSGMQIAVKGKAAHAGVNATGGRNAIVALAGALVDELPEGGARDLLAFAQLAGRDLQGTGLGLTQVDPVFGRVIAVPTMIRLMPDGRTRLTVNIRSNPSLSGDALKQHLAAEVAAFNARTGASLEAGGRFAQQPLAIDPQAKLVKRLLAAYERGTGQVASPAVSGGGTYAKSLPNAIAFGMWFPDKPYPGHDVDEQISVADLHKGTRVLLAALADLACTEPLKEPFKP